MSGLTIGELARRAETSVETIRYYERRGLIAEPPRRASGYRQYPPEAQRRRRLLRAGARSAFNAASDDVRAVLLVGPT